MPDHDLTRLGSRAFEQLVVALARHDIGSGVQVFGDGPDGGREATFEGTINWSKTASEGQDGMDQWSGYTVLQAKFNVKPSREPKDNAVWLQGQIKSDLDGWIRAAKEHTRARLPDYLIFITNVDLSPMAKIGGIDKVNQVVQRWLRAKDTWMAGLRVKNVAIWHADQLRSMLDAYQEVRWAFPALLTAGDVLARLAPESVSLGSFDAQDPLREQLLHAIKADRWIRLSQSGGPGEAKLWLDDIAIDLPAKISRRDGTATVQAVQHVLRLGDMVLRQRQPDRIRRPHIVLVGGPGQGKSTLSQLIAQAYRVALLEDASPGPTIREIVESTRDALERLGLGVPGNRRWPVRIDLAKYAEELATGREVSLLRWIATQVSERTDRAVSPNDLRTWLRAWPWALILDGLDEVPSAHARRQIYSRIDDLLTTAEDHDADLLIVVTTRPTGYDERFPSDRFEHLDLQRLPAEAAAAFAQQITDKRFTNDDEMRFKVAARMGDAAHDPVTRRLMETPLQVTIMSFIVEKYPTLPPDRFTLFDLYYLTMFDREVAKDIPIARFLSQHRPQIDSLHEQVGLTLQAASEIADGADAWISTRELHDIALAHLVARGFGASEAEKHATALVEAATHRLVLLGPRDGGVGFDIRTLQELMAARAICEGDDTVVLSRLRLVAHHPHWRNTWLLAAGVLLLRSDRFEKRILELLKQLDTDLHRLNDRYPSGPGLAADILEDNLAVNRPRFESGLLQRLFVALDRTPLVDRRRVGAAILRIAETESYRRMVYETIAAAASDGPLRRAAADVLLEDMMVSLVTLGRDNNVGRTALTKAKISAQMTLTAADHEALDGWRQTSHQLGVKLAPHTDPALAEINLASHLSSLAEAIGLLHSPEQELLSASLAAAVGNSRFRLAGLEPGTAVPVLNRPGAPDRLLQALQNEDIATSLDLVLGTLPPAHWAIATMLGDAFKSAQNRQPVGPELLRAVAAANADNNAYGS
ncbi:NACHT domain-containing protein [Actinacidiphila glaucinigra]|uniref:NACHT domain-containing protein n=1 Tax=Actinacidiphila glaucinigra TaxID=235986 RepID=UPI00367315FF